MENGRKIISTLHIMSIFAFKMTKIAYPNYWMSYNGISEIGQNDSGHPYGVAEVFFSENMTKHDKHNNKIQNIAMKHKSVLISKSVLYNIKVTKCIPFSLKIWSKRLRFV